MRKILKSFTMLALALSLVVVPSMGVFAGDASSDQDVSCSDDQHIGEVYDLDGYLLSERLISGRAVHSALHSTSPAIRITHSATKAGASCTIIHKAVVYCNACEKVVEDKGEFYRTIHVH